MPRPRRTRSARGIIIADTKFEFGLDDDDTLTLMDEVLTPDSSRFWPADEYVEGRNPPSFDKQFVRDWLESSLGRTASPGTRRSPRRPCPRRWSRETAAAYRSVAAQLGA